MEIGRLTQNSKIAVQEFSISCVIFWFIICCLLRTWETIFPTDQARQLWSRKILFVILKWFLSKACKSQKLHMKCWKRREMKIFILRKVFFHYFYSCRVLFKGERMTRLIGFVRGTWVLNLMLNFLKFGLFLVNFNKKRMTRWV